MKQEKRWAAGAALVTIVATMSTAPSAASASTIYPPAGSCTSSPAAVSAGDDLQFSCQANTFGPNEQVTITVTGESGAASRIGMVRFGITTASGVTESSADGSLRSIPITLPADGSGTYNIAAISARSSGGSAAATITSDPGALPFTGLNSSATLGIFIGGGALLAAGLALGVAVILRRHRDAD